MTHVDDLHEPNDREPGEPEQEPPLDLDDLEKLYDLSGEPGALPAWAHVVYLNVPVLIAELREARERIAEWEASETREEWTVTGGPNFPSEPGGRTVWPDAGVIAYIRMHATARLWRRKLSVHPWEPISTEAPF